jgi:hypothetical protein
MNASPPYNPYATSGNTPTWSPGLQPLYYPPVPQNVYYQPPRQQSSEGVLAFLVGLSFFLTWLDSRRQTMEIRQLQQQLSSQQHQHSIQGTVMNQPIAITSTAPNSAATSNSFGDGTHFVGAGGLEPGIYRVAEPGLRYFVARLRNFTGQNAVLANWSGVTPGIIEILSADVGVEARGGVTWRLCQRHD